MVLCPILKSNCAGIVSNHRGEGSQMRTVLPCRRDNNHPFFTRSCGRATTKELSTMENKFVASEIPTFSRFTGNVLPLFPSSLVLMSLEKLIVSFFSAWSRYARKLAIYSSPSSQLSCTRVFVILSWKKEGDEKKKLERLVERFRRSSARGKHERWVVVMFANCKRSETNAG